MTTAEIVEAMIDRIAELPGDAQADLMTALVEMRCPHLGVDELDPGEPRQP